MLVVSQNKGTPIQTPIYDNPFYGNPQKGSPIFRKLPNVAGLWPRMDAEGSRKRMTSRTGSGSGLIMGIIRVIMGYRGYVGLNIVYIGVMGISP